MLRKQKSIQLQSIHTTHDHPFFGGSNVEFSIILHSQTRKLVSTLFFSMLPNSFMTEKTSESIFSGGSKRTLGRKRLRIVENKSLTKCLMKLPEKLLLSFGRHGLEDMTHSP